MLIAPEEHIGRSHVVERFVIPVIVVVLYEAGDRLFQLPRIAVGQRLLSGLGQRAQRDAAESKLTLAATDGEALDPARGSGGA